MTNHKKCRHLLSSLSEYVDGELSEVLCEELEAHMAHCEDCQIVVNTLQKTVYLYHSSAETPEIPLDVQKRLYERLNLEEFLDEPLSGEP
jgi:anti-sigma factor RsiW